MQKKFGPGLIVIVILLAWLIFPGAVNAQNLLSAETNDPYVLTESGQVFFQFQPGDIQFQDISFTAPISGLDALIQATTTLGLDLVTKDFGGGFIAVCQIGEIGCPAEECFCGGTKFWNYEFWDGSTWQSHSTGAADSELYDGVIDGWRWGEFNGQKLPQPPAARAYSWLRSQQTADGGFGSESFSVEAALAAGANGYPSSSWRQRGSFSLEDYWLRKSAPYSYKGAAEAGKMFNGLVPTNTCVPIASKLPGTYYTPGTGTYDVQPGFHIWGMLGDAALDNMVPIDALAYLKSLQKSDGGWEWNTGFGTDANTTALAIQALIASGEDPSSQAIIDARAFMKGSQNEDGGFYYTSIYGTESDSNTTAYAIQAIYALDEDPTSGDWVTPSSNPVKYLLGNQLPNGSIKWKSTPDPPFFEYYSTTQSIPALLGKYLPYTQNNPGYCKGMRIPVVLRIN
jgi:hypothetical protein